jgi:hypothetical protein
MHHTAGETSLAEKRARASRFAREARNPPPVQKKQMAWAGGKIETSNPEVALLKLLERKSKAGLALTDDQQRAMASLRDVEGLKSSHPASADAALKERSGNLPHPQPAPKQHQQRCATAPLVKVKVAPGVAQAIARDAVRPEARKLEKKLRECEDLERRVALGEALEQNQRMKIGKKAEWMRLLAAM